MYLLNNIKFTTSYIFIYFYYYFYYYNVKIRSRWKKKCVGKSEKVRWEKRMRSRWKKSSHVQKKNCGQKCEGKMREENQVTLKKKNCHQGESIFVKLSSSIFDSTFPSYFSSRFGRIKILDLGEKIAIRVFYPSHFPSLPKLWKIAFSTLFSFLYFLPTKHSLKITLISIES